MAIRKFQARTSRDALRLVRQALGPEALILSNRGTAGGVEIVAAPAEEVDAMTSAADAVSTPAAPAQPSARSDADARVAFVPAPQSATGTHRTTDRLGVERIAAALPDTGRLDAPGLDAAHLDAPDLDVPGLDVRGLDAPDFAAPDFAVPDFTVRGRESSRPVSAQSSGSDLRKSDAERTTGGGYEVLHELRVLRSLVEGQLAAFAYTDLKRRDAAKGEVLRRLLAVGFSAALSRQAIDTLPDGLDAPGALRLVKVWMQERLRMARPEAGLVDAGGIIALVGPTGVGKTTTVAKLAAECAIRHGPEKLALVTTDTYRIGAVDQLRIYGKIIGVPVYAIRTEADLRTTLADLHARHLVLIDTVGMSQRDRRLAQQVALLSGAAGRVRRVLLLSAVAQVNVIEDVVRAYKGDDLAGCILTKIDEALTFGSAVDALIRHDLTLHYVTNGQRVPEDLHRPNSLYLIERAFRDGGQALDESDVGLTFAAGQN